MKFIVEIECEKVASEEQRIYMENVGEHPHELLPSELYLAINEYLGANDYQTSHLSVERYYGSDQTDVCRESPYVPES